MEATKSPITMATTTPQKPFRVIIVGGSVAGLTLANALERAGVDYVMLEKRDVAPNKGQSILVMPCTALVFEQLGIHKVLDEVCHPLKTREHWDAKMKLFCSSDELWLLYQKCVPCSSVLAENDPVQYLLAPG